MLEKLQKLSLLLLFSLSVSCSSVLIKNTELCSVAGDMSAGAICANTLEKETREMTLEEFIVFLSPNEKENKGAAICTSSHDFNEMKTSLEVACSILEDQCSYELKQTINAIKKKIDGIQEDLNNYDDYSDWDDGY